MTDFMAHSIYDDCFCKAHEVAGEGLRDVGEFHTWGACGLDDYDPARVDLPGVGRGNPAGGGDMTGEPIDLAERTIARVRSELAGAQWKIRAALALHRCCTDVPVQDGGCAGEEHGGDADPPICVRCDEPWPCRDVQALQDDSCHCGHYTLEAAEFWYTVDGGGYIHGLDHCGSAEDDEGWR